MGFQDRDYYRDGQTPASRAAQSVVVRLILLNGTLWLANLFFGGDHNAITRALALDKDAIIHPWMWYQFLTAGFVHDWGSLLHLIGNMIGLYVLGMPLERRLGAAEFLRFYLLSIVVGFLVWAVRNHFLVAAPAGSCLGASGGVTATIILFCLYDPRATLLLFGAVPVPAWIFGLLIIAADVLAPQPTAFGPLVAHDVHLAGAAFAVAYWKFGLNFGKLPGLERLRRLWRSPQKWLRAKPPNLRVHDPEQYYDDLDKQADRLLEKVKEGGLESLSPKERQLLEDYSRRTRQKLR